MSTSFVLRSEAVLGPAGPRPASVEVVNGVVTRVVPERLPGAIDLGQRWLAPSLVDPHVHVNEPGRTEWEGFATATRAAAKGGITTLVDMPLNSDPVTTTLSAFEAKLAAAEGQLHVDVGFWGGVVPGNAAELAPMIGRGALGFKCFLCHSGIDDFPNATEADLRVAMPILRDGGVPLLVHAELESELRAAAADARSPREYLRFLHSRPKEFEDRAIALMIDLCRDTGCPVHVVHLSSATALPMIRAAKREGLPLTVETCPHYLCLTAEEVPDGATEFKCVPPIREADNREALWAALSDGTIDLVVSDHSPCVPALKLPEVGDFLAAWGGIASLQLGFSAVSTEADGRGYGPDRVVSWMGRGSRRLAGLPAAEAIAPGVRADLVAFAPDETFEVRPETLLHRHKVTPYAGRRLRTVVTDTWVRGHRVVADRELVGAPVGRPVLGRQR